MSTRTQILQKLAYLLIILFISTYVLIIGKQILAPLAFGAFLAFMLKPICNFFEGWGLGRIPAIFFAIICISLPVFIILALFSYQLSNVFAELPEIGKQLRTGLTDLQKVLRQQFGLTWAESKEIISSDVADLVKNQIAFLGTGVTSSTAALIGALLTLVYTFLFLLYRSAFRNFYFIQFGEAAREKASKILKNIQYVIQRYLYGLMIVIFILGCMNSLGLWLIGIDFPVFWGFLGAFLAIIPYIGSFLGGFLPFLYSYANSDDWWQPVSVALLFFFVQIIEGNFITPKIIGKSVDINPLVAIFALLLGGSIWGIAGMVLALPFIALLKVVLAEINVLKPVSLLMGSELLEKQSLLKGKYDKEKFRIRSFFRKP